MKKKVIIGIAAILTLTVLSFFFYKKNKTVEVTYGDYTIKRGDISTTILATGTVQPKNRLEIKAPIAGRIDQVLTKEGTKVKKGQ
ncbi:MAG: efflux RND transporter periplasmic adaptor subunit, partial [Alphaproteobacteria bacterium]